MNNSNKLARDTHAPSSQKIRFPVTFMCGALRSGTTMVRLMLDNHNHISNVGEYDFLVEWPVEFDDQTAKDYINWLRSDRIFKKSGLRIDDTLDRVQLVRSFVDQLAAENKVTTINIHRHFDRLPALFPEARYIHLLRDPRDVARSSIGMGWAANVYYGVDHWVDTEESWNSLRDLIAPDRFMEIRFEDVVTKPQETLQRVCEFLSLDFDQKMLDYHQNSTYSKPDTSLIYQWKRKLSADEIALVESKASVLMKSRQYEIVSSLPVNIPCTRKLHLWVNNKSGRFVSSVKRIGLVLTLLQIVTRKLGFQTLSRAVNARIDKIVDQQVK